MTSMTQTAAVDSKVVEMAIGRIFGMMQRSTQPGDVAEYERCRAIILDQIGPAPAGYVPNYARDRMSGAAGD